MEAAFHAKRLVYGLELESNMTAAGRTGGRLVLKGRWMLEPAKQGDRSFALARLADAELTSESADPAEQQVLEAAIAQLSQPLAFAVDARGAVTEVRESAEMRPDVSSLVRSIPTFAQFVRPEQLAETWTATERDATGEYEATYTERADGEYGKRKTAYTRVAGGSNPMLNASSELRVTDSDYAYKFDAQGVLKTLKLSETLAAKAQLVEQLEVTTRMTLTLLRVEDVTSVAELPGGLVVSSLKAQAAKRVSSLQADLSRVGGRSFEELLETFDGLPPYEERTKEQKVEARIAFQALAAKLRLEEATVDAALEEIEDGSPHAKELWSALGSAGTPRAQEALRQLIDMPDWEIQDRRSQMVALSMVDRPTGETIDFLHAKFQDPEQGRQATYGVGTAVNRLKDAAPEEAARAFGILEAALKAEQDPAKKATLLTGVGNTGYSRALEVVEPHLADKEIQVREAAVHALRLAPGEVADHKLSRALIDDSDVMVRLAAIEALGDRSPTQENLTALAHAARGDASKEVRESANRLLARFATGSDEVARALAQFEAEQGSSGG